MSVDWKQAVGGNISEGFVAENLNLNEMYVLELIETDYQENVSMTFQGDTQITDRFKTIWQVEGHKTKVWIYFNLPVGYLKGVAGPNERSNVVAFAKRFKPVPKDQPFRLSEFFQDHMRIRAYLKKQEGKDFYNVDLGTVQPFNVPCRAEAPDEKENQIFINTLKMYKSLDEAKAVWKVIAPGKSEAQLFLLWNRMVAEREGAVPINAKTANGPLIDADKVQAQAQKVNGATPQ